MLEAARDHMGIDLPILYTEQSVYYFLGLCRLGVMFENHKYQDREHAKRDTETGNCKERECSL